MKQLFIFNESSNAAIYGIGTYITQLTDYLSDSGLELNVVHLHSGEIEFRQETIAGIKYYYFPHPPNFAGHNYDSYNNRYYRNIFYILYPYMNENPTFLLNYNQSIALVQNIRKRFHKSKVVFTLHYLSWCFTIQGDINYLREIIHKQEHEITDSKEINILKSFKKEQQLFLKMDKVICLSHFTYDLLLNDYKIPHHLLMFIPNALSENSEHPHVTDKAVLKKQYHFNPDEKILLYAGRLERTKGILFLIEAFREILKEVPDCRLLIAGNGDYDSCQKECKGIWSKITFTGRVDKKQLYEFYQIADIGILPSLHEQCSYVAIEMMLHGLPVVSTDACGLKEMFSDIPENFRVNIRYEKGVATIPIDNLKKSIIHLLEDEESRSSISRSVKQKHNRYYNSKNIGKKICGLLCPTTQ